MKNLLIVFAMLSMTAFSQSNPKKYTISGYMKDSLSTESLIGAAIVNKANFAGTSTNQYGFYSLTLPAGNVELVYSYVGYNTQVCRFLLRRNTVINVLLEGALHLQEVEITASRADRIQESTQMSVVRVLVAQIKSLPASEPTVQSLTRVN